MMLVKDLLTVTYLFTLFVMSLSSPLQRKHKTPVTRDHNFIRKKRENIQTSNFANFLNTLHEKTQGKPSEISHSFTSNTEPLTDSTGIQDPRANNKLQAILKPSTSSTHRNDKSLMDFTGVLGKDVNGAHSMLHIETSKINSHTQNPAKNWRKKNFLSAKLAEGRERIESTTQSAEETLLKNIVPLFQGLGPVEYPTRKLSTGSSQYNSFSDVLDFMDSPLDVPVKYGRPIPEQIHLAHADNITDMVVMCASRVKSAGLPIIQYGLAPNNYSLETIGSTAIFFYDNEDGARYHHRIVLQNLIPGQTYSYRIQLDNETSEGFMFTTLKDGQDWGPHMIVYGDMGRKGGAPSLRRLKLEAKSRKYDAFLHVGDFAYNMNDEHGLRGDQFMQRIQDIAANVPYMTCPGNHERHASFAHYRYHFSMPSNPWPMNQEQMWYSWNVGNVHFISYSTEHYFYVPLFVDVQHDWLLQDLTEANLPENRAKRPWIIAFGHRPMYCSNMDRDDCTKASSKVRNGLEHLFYTQGVDVIIEAHEHSYERLYPMYNHTLISCNYTDPRAPVHVISGAAGCNEGHGYCADIILGAAGPWSAYRSWVPGLNGYGRLKVLNNTHLHWEQVIALNGQIMDEFTLIQHNHGPFPNETVSTETECAR